MKPSELSAPFARLHLDRVDSTNSEALRRAAGGERGPLWLTATEQTNGRGRSGRAWSAPHGNVAATLLFSPQCKPATLHQLAFVAGVAVHDAISHAAGPVPGLKLKWPNDILIAGAKTGGILVETTTFGAESVAAIGIGLNIADAPEIEGRAIAKLTDHAPALTADGMLGRLDEGFRYWLPLWSYGDGFAAVRAAWLSRASTIGRPLAVNAGSERIEGTFDGIDEGGALLLRMPDGTMKRLTYGDVSLIGAPTIASERTA